MRDQLTKSRGDAYAVAQRFWEFSGVFLSPVRFIIALVFLYRYAFTCAAAEDTSLSLTGAESSDGALLQASWSFWWRTG